MPLFISCARSVHQPSAAAPADLALQLTASPVANYGYSSPYVAAAFDVARLLQSFRTAQYQ